MSFGAGASQRSPPLSPQRAGGSPGVQRLLAVIESLAPSKGSLGFLCGVVHAQVFAVVDGGTSSTLHVVDHANEATWTVLADNRTGETPHVNSATTNAGQGTFTSQHNSRVWCKFGTGKAGLAASTNRVIYFENKIFVPVVFDSGGEDVVLGVLEVVKAVGSTRQEHQRGPSAPGAGRILLQRRGDYVADHLRALGLLHRFLRGEAA